MYKILCLTTGTEICWPLYYTNSSLTTKLVPTEVQEQLASTFIGSGGQPGRVMLFNTEDAASWFVRRRLSYNPKRQDYQKLDFMNRVFEASGLDPSMYTKKHMFEIIKV